MARIGAGILAAPNGARLHGQVSTRSPAGQLFVRIGGHGASPSCNRYRN
ncbi:hypothetical protein ACFFX0_31915 [Citricoccus parietis]|uniref:Uncharacterized protein n=1 Tax=Citricoccus parietis TaxID=592307 RepID=A0ABV5G988_9MICC